MTVTAGGSSAGPRVGLARVREDDIGVARAVEAAGGLERLVGSGARVLVKPNLVAVPPHPRNGAVTWVEVTRAVADLVRDLGGDPVIADSAAVGACTGDVMAVCGYDALRDAGYRVVDLKAGEEVEVEVPGGLVVKRLVTYRPVVEADVIVSVPVLKTHDQLGASLALKNLKGLLADRDKKRLHTVGVVEGICDLLGVLPPVYAVVDGSVGQEGLGPVFGRPVPLGVVLAGADPVAVDTVSGWLMGFEPEELPLSRRAAERGLGCGDLASIRVVGEEPSPLRRRFLRAEEGVSLDIPGFRLVFAPGTCTGCHNTVLSVVAEITEEGCQDVLRGKMVLAGPVREGALAAPDRLPPEPGLRVAGPGGRGGDEGRCGRDSSCLVLVGNCAAGHARGGTWVRGCPPHNDWVKEALMSPAPGAGG
ncbi:MAG: DUF362 domain-containing protein [Firmicutes bacterium]|nr:DUF362 domain-containing protein [Bacillota bacterium]